MTSLMVAILVVVGLALVTSVAVVRTRESSRLTRAELAATNPPRYSALDRPVPARLAAVGDALAAAGLHHVEDRLVRATAFPAHMAQVLYLSEDRRILAAAIAGFGDTDPEPFLEVSSALTGGKGVLVTQDLRGVQPVPDEVLLQTVDDGTPATMLAVHEQAVALLAERGVRISRLRDPRAMVDLLHELAARPWNRENDAARAATRRNLRGQRRDQHRPLVEWPDLELDERIAWLVCPRTSM